jgi:hypothetical protein
VQGRVDGHMPAMERVEDGDAIGAANHGLAVNSECPCLSFAAALAIAG